MRPEAAEGDDSLVARTGWAPPGGRFEYRVLTLEPGVSRNDARRMLTEEAEYGHWELARSATYVGGRRRVWLRRRIMRVTSTLAR